MSNALVFAVTLILTVLVLGSMASRMIVSVEKVAAQRAFMLNSIDSGN